MKKTIDSVIDSDIRFTIVFQSSSIVFRMFVNRNLLQISDEENEKIMKIVRSQVQLGNEDK